jgi:hypothetical protein
MGCLLLGAAAPAPTDTPSSPAPDEWSIVATKANGGCAAKTPPVDGVSLGLALSGIHTLSIAFGDNSWRLNKDTYDVPIRLDDFPAHTVTMFGKGTSLIAQMPPDMRPAFMTAGKVGFHFTQKDFTIPVHDVAGVVARLETCVAAEKPAETPTDKPAEKPAE